MSERVVHSWVPAEDLPYQIVHWVHMMPWLSVAEMAAVFLLPESTVRDAVNELGESRQLFHLQIGANKRVTDRYALRGRGLIELSRSEGRSLSAGWQATESGLLTRLKRLPMTEAFYGLVPGLCQSSLLHDQYLEYPRELDDPRGPDSGFLRGSRLVRFSWNSAGSLHATASFETVTGQILDVGFRWEGRQRPIPSLPKVDDLVDPRTTVLVLADHLQAIRFRPLLEKAKLESGETGPVFIPVVWDGAAWCEAPQAVHLFRFPATYRMNWQEKIGIPEKLEDLLAALPVGGVLDIRSMRILERVESWAGSNFTVAAQGSRMSRGRAKPIFIDLVNRALVRKFDGVYHLAEEGMKQVAIRDRVSLKSVKDRCGTYLKEDGRYRKQQRRHNLGRARLAAQVTRSRGVRVAPGEMWVVDLQHPLLGTTQLKPDLWLQMLLSDGGWVWCPVEYELTAIFESQILKKLGPWEKAQLFGRDWPVLVVTGTEQGRDSFATLGYGLGIPMAAVAQKDFAVAVQTYPLGQKVAPNAPPVPEAAVLRSNDIWGTLSELAYAIQNRWQRADLVSRLQPVTYDEDRSQGGLVVDQRVHSLRDVMRWEWEDVGH